MKKESDRTWPRITSGNVVVVDAGPGAQSSRYSSFIGTPINPAVAVEQTGHPSGFVILAVAASAATGLLWIATKIKPGKYLD
jgi:hypothetical protein